MLGDGVSRVGISTEEQRGALVMRVTFNCEMRSMKADTKKCSQELQF